ncbi:MAG: hypothetical protein HUU57_06340 [Bdellovibrio sp.]|nr:hypothetical protein [Bdellovibrio sp.]
MDYLKTFSIPTTGERVPLNTTQYVNEKIFQKTIDRLNEIGFDGEKIEQRLKEIEAEWDVERAIEANAALATLATLGLALAGDKKWLVATATIAGFLLQHSLQGWCPPLPVLRRLGFRTQREIDDERMVLKARQGGLGSLHKDTRTALDSLH